MNYATAPHSRRSTATRHHGIRPSATTALARDWSEVALQRTWRTAGNLLMLLGLANAGLARLPAVLIFLLGIWAHLKGHPALRERLARHRVIGAPLRWWLGRNQGKANSRG